MNHSVKKWLCGWLILKVTGVKTGRFLSLCMNHGIEVWSVEEKDSGCLQLSMFLYDVPKLKKLRAKSAVHIRFVERHGLIFQMRKHSNWPCVVVVIAVLVFLCVQYRSHIWYVKVDGNSFLSDETCEQLLRQAGFYPGIRKRNLDCKSLCSMFLQQSGEISWASVSKEGQTLYLDIRENLDADSDFGMVPEESEDYMYSLVADQNATISSIITRNGTPNVKVGDEVLVGDVLIYGREAILDDSGEIADYLYLCADGDVEGFVSYDWDEPLSSFREERTDTGNFYTRFFVGIGDHVWEIPGIYPDYYQSRQVTVYDKVSLLPLMDQFLWIGKRTVYEQDISLYKTDRTLAMEESEKLFSGYLLDLEEEGVKILRKNLAIEYVDGGYRMVGHVEGTATIGCYKKEGKMIHEYE